MPRETRRSRLRKTAREAPRERKRCPSPLSHRACRGQALSGLEVAGGRSPQVRGLNGWVFEQTLRTCLWEGLRMLGLDPEFGGQVPLGGRAKVDLLVGGIAAIEIKVGGFFGDDEGGRYARYRGLAEARG